MSSVRVLHRALRLQVVNEQRNRLQQMLLWKLGGGEKSLRDTSAAARKADALRVRLAPDF